jgi:predicted membrane protein
MAIIYALGRGGAVIALVLLVVALLKQLIVMVGFLLALVKFAIIIAFVAVLVMIGLAIFRDRSRRKREAEGL